MGVGWRGLFILGVGRAGGREGGRLFGGDGEKGGVCQKNLQILDLQRLASLHSLILLLCLVFDCFVLVVLFCSFC